jgi:hypothetical protein
MAKFGDFSDWSLSEVLYTTAKRGGKLEMWGLPQGQYIEVHIHDQAVQAMFVNGEPLAVFAASQLLSQLLPVHQGEFEVHPGRTEQLTKHFHLKVSDVLLFRDQSQRNSELPDVKTRFVFAAVSPDITSEYLADVLDRCSHLLFDPGCDAKTLAKTLGISEDNARQHLHNLRLAGIIAPARATVAEANGGQTPAQKPKTPQPTLFTRLLGALLGRKPA